MVKLDEYTSLSASSLTTVCVIVFCKSTPHVVVVYCVLDRSVITMVRRRSQRSKEKVDYKQLNRGRQPSPSVSERSRCSSVVEDNDSDSVVEAVVHVAETQSQSDKAMLSVEELEALIKQREEHEKKIELMNKLEAINDRIQKKNSG